ncbi:uncharacterized protein N7511_003536 [Penicillium nucicola]|uniref:uncharacterized protein n=1 Tax=Penicillium nucicola TaxID=1850975 RepID=UPI002544E49C|nr:uncharacterized protein N7511_003536 [Penicillium nucicola]KAJ5771485.1 hypothetical protein N7511_003536 [Penicillium nucicola]
MQHVGGYEGDKDIQHLEKDNSDLDQNSPDEVSPKIVAATVRAAQKPVDLLTDNTFCGNDPSDLFASTAERALWKVLYVVATVTGKKALPCCTVIFKGWLIRTREALTKCDGLHTVSLEDIQL